MKRIGKVLHALFSRLPFARARQGEIFQTAPAPIRETASPLNDEDRLLALRLRRTVEDRRLFLRPCLSTADVAGELKVATDTLERIFALFIGENFSRYLDELRISYAAVLFMGRESHLYSLEKIGTECGFPDNAAFVDACRNLTGMTPEVMREFTRGRKTLKGLFLNPPVYMTTVFSNMLQEGYAVRIEQEISNN